MRRRRADLVQERSQVGDVGLHQVFGAALDFGRVKIHNRRAYFFQPSNTAITPNGEVYFPPASYKDDFSTTIGDASWLIHELTHAWQYQQGMWVKLRAVFNRNYHYGDLSRSRRPFLSYGIEAQASIVTDYFLLAHHRKPQHGSGAFQDYVDVIPFAIGETAWSASLSRCSKAC